MNIKEFWHFVTS